MPRASQELFGVVSSLKKSHAGFVVHPYIYIKGLLLLWEVVLLRKQTLVSVVTFLNNGLQSLVATSVPTHHSFVLKKNSWALHNCIACGFVANLRFGGQRSIRPTVGAPLPESPRRD